MCKIIIYCPQHHNSLQFVLDFIGNQYIDLEFILCHSIDFYVQSELAKINYSENRILENEVFIYNKNRLEDIQNLNFPDKFYKNNGCFLYSSDQEDDLGFDLFTAIFWMLTNYEERSNLKRDEHQRFLSTYSIFSANKDFKKPIVDEWVNLLLEKIQHKYKVKILYRNTFSWSVGIDVDQVWKYKYKAWWKTYGALIKNVFNFNFVEFKQRLRCIFFNQIDPFDSFDSLSQFNFSKKQLIFFILNGNNKHFDPNHSIHLPEYKKLLLALKEHYTLGLHPSYDSINSVDLILQQKLELEKLLGQIIDCSRQHYLRLQLPQTYKKLIMANIHKDYSMIYADTSGFRSGTCSPYFYFNIEDNSVSSLLLIPAITMDRCYIKYTKFHSVEILSDVEQLIALCKKYHGHFHFIWHNSSFDFNAEWKGWEIIFPKIIEKLNQE